MPSRLRPTASFAADAILVGDPGRALMFAQELLEQPKMCNHARGLWGYTGSTPGGEELTIQSTGMGGPSAALVLADLAELGVRRAVRVGSCHGASAGPGDLLLVERALPGEGSGAAFGLGPDRAASPDPDLNESLRRALGGEAEGATVASLDVSPPGGGALGPEVAAADMQTAAVLARARALGVAAAATLFVIDSADGRKLAEDDRERVERTAGRAAGRALSPSS